MSDSARHTKVAVIGAGFTGLSIAFELAQHGVPVTVLEAESELGGLAAAFDVGGARLDRFYHHWFTNDLEVMALIDVLGLQEHVMINPTNTGIYYANNFFKLSTPIDLLKFKPLSFINRIRLGFLAIRARRVKHWRELENKSAREWLLDLGGKSVYEVVWEPLLKGKFGSYAEQISAVWFWNKLKLRGGSRGARGEERLAYFKGGFTALAGAMADYIRANGSCIETNARVHSIERCDGHWVLQSGIGTISSDLVVSTTALPILADLVRNWASVDYIEALNRIKYLGNVCLVLELDHSLSTVYWLNVNETTFPFVGVIEHTNFELPESYGGSHIVYLSKYLPDSDPLYSLSSEEFLEYALPFLKRMFPALERKWIKSHYLWRERWSQPVVEKNYSSLVPNEDGPADGLFLCSMAQIYPEDRGTNYAIREGRRMGRKIAKVLANSEACHE